MDKDFKKIANDLDQIYSQISFNSQLTDEELQEVCEAYDMVYESMSSKGFSDSAINSFICDCDSTELNEKFGIGVRLLSGLKGLASKGAKVTKSGSKVARSTSKVTGSASDAVRSTSKVTGSASDAVRSTKGGAKITGDVSDTASKVKQGRITGDVLPSTTKVKSGRITGDVITDTSTKSNRLRKAATLGILGAAGTGLLLGKDSKKDESEPSSDAPSAPAPAPAPSAPAPSAPVRPTKTSTSDREINKKYDELRKTDPDKAREYGMTAWAKKFPHLAKRVRPGSSGYEEIQKALKEIEDSNNKVNEDTYDVILSYLFDAGHAETIEEANYIMLNLDSSDIANIMEIYNYE